MTIASCFVTPGGVVLGADSGIPLPSNTGDWLALGSGISWALGSLTLYKLEHVGVPEKAISFIMGSAVLAAAFLLFGGPSFGGPLPLPELLGFAPFALLCGIYMWPTIILTPWPASVLTPGRVGILLMSEVVVGVGSAALFAGEVFGGPEFIGTVLIVSAAFLEVIGTARPRGRRQQG